MIFFLLVGFFALQAHFGQEHIGLPTIAKHADIVYSRQDDMISFMKDRGHGPLADRIKASLDKALSQKMYYELARFASELKGEERAVFLRAISSVIQRGLSFSVHEKEELLPEKKGQDGVSSSSSLEMAPVRTPEAKHFLEGQAVHRSHSTAFAKPKVSQTFQGQSVEVKEPFAQGHVSRVSGRAKHTSKMRKSSFERAQVFPNSTASDVNSVLHNKTFLKWWDKELKLCKKSPIDYASWSSVFGTLSQSLRSYVPEDSYFVEKFSLMQLCVLMYFASASDRDLLGKGLVNSKGEMSGKSAYNIMASFEDPGFSFQQYLASLVKLSSDDLFAVFDKTPHVNMKRASSEEGFVQGVLRVFPAMREQMILKLEKGLRPSAQMEHYFRRAMRIVNVNEHLVIPALCFFMSKYVYAKSLRGFVSKLSAEQRRNWNSMSVPARAQFVLKQGGGTSGALCFYAWCIIGKAIALQGSEEEFEESDGSESLNFDQKGAEVFTHMLAYRSRAANVSGNDPWRKRLEFYLANQGGKIAQTMWYGLQFLPQKDQWTAVYLMTLFLKCVTFLRFQKNMDQSLKEQIVFSACQCAQAYDDMFREILSLADHENALKLFMLYV